MVLVQKVPLAFLFLALLWYMSERCGEVGGGWYRGPSLYRVRGQACDLRRYD